jgi:iron-sulfur cluster repair protein YtfE (RIC family)
MSQSITSLPLNEVELAALTIRDITDVEPRALELLAPLGIDLCCGGGHPLGEALDLHGIDRKQVMPQLIALAADTKR